MSACPIQAMDGNVSIVIQSATSCQIVVPLLPLSCYLPGYIDALKKLKTWDLNELDGSGR